MDEDDEVEYAAIANELKEMYEVLLPDRHYMVHQIDGTYNIVRGNPYHNPPAVKTGLTREEALAFMKLLK